MNIYGCLSTLLSWFIKISVVRRECKHVYQVGCMFWKAFLNWLESKQHIVCLHYILYLWLNSNSHSHRKLHFSPRFLYIVVCSLCTTVAYSKWNPGVLLDPKENAEVALSHLGSKCKLYIIRDIWIHLWCLDSTWRCSLTDEATL